MTDKEALKMIPRIKRIYGTPDFTRGIYSANEWFSNVEDAIKKQIPKKVGYRALRQTEWGSPWHCPECEAELIEVCFGDDENKVSYCWHCGQAIDWSDEDE